MYNIFGCECVMNFLKLKHYFIKNGIVLYFKPQNTTILDDTVCDDHLQSNKFDSTLG